MERWLDEIFTDPELGAGLAAKFKSRSSQGHGGMEGMDGNTVRRSSVAALPRVNVRWNGREQIKRGKPDWNRRTKVA